MEILVEDRIHILLIVLYNFEKFWDAAQPFRDFNELFGQKLSWKVVEEVQVGRCDPHRLVGKRRPPGLTNNAYFELDDLVVAFKGGMPLSTATSVESTGCQANGKQYLK